jgi:hypothetical protein
MPREARVSDVPDDIQRQEEQPVIDIHPPHEAAHSWRDILIHLATITVGLFIALSLEGCVEWQHHRNLVREARANIRSEIEDNQKELHNALDQIHKEQAQVKADIEALKVLRKDMNAKGLSVSLTFANSALQNASWDTARETGAFSYMSYPEVKKYAELYNLQQLFANQTTRVTAAYTNSFSVLYIFDVDEKQTAEVRRADVNSGLQRILAVQSELMVYDSVARELADQYSAALRQY